jgi:hypothetical protein
MRSGFARDEQTSSRKVCSHPANKTPRERHLQKARHAPGDQLDRHQSRSHFIRSVSGELAHTRDICCFKSHQHSRGERQRGTANSKTKHGIEINKLKGMFTPSKKTHPKMHLRKPGVYSHRQKRVLNLQN